ncbi:MAG: hypothetical protein NVSMB12_14060 [Acidimicrobiales bacterium]
MQRRRVGGLLVASGVAGVVAAHSAAYAIAIPDGARRARHLQATGHGYWSVAIGLACVGGLIAVVGAGVRGRAVALARAMAPTDRRVATAGLVSWQLALFSAIEVVERLGSGSPTGALVRDPAFLLGLGIQVLVALLIVMVLRSIERGVELLVFALRRRTAQSPADRPAWIVADQQGTSWLGRQPGARGPPTSAFC